MRMNAGAARLAEKSQIPEAEHVERGEQGGHKPDKPQHLATAALQERRIENGVLREEACEREEAGDGEDGCRHGPESDGEMLAQAAHLAQILLAAHAVNHRTGS